MGTLIHVIVITALGGLIVLILSRIGRKNAPEANEAAYTGRSRKNASLISIAVTIAVLAGGAFLFYKFMPSGGPAPVKPAGSSADQSTPSPPAFETSVTSPGAGMDSKPLPPPPPLTAKETQTIHTLYQQIGPSVVFILTYKGSQQKGFGSGFFINHKGDVITNHHVLRDADSAKVRLPNGKEYEIRSVLAEDVANDLVMASVKVPSGEVRPLSVSTTLPAVGERVIVVGSPAGLEQTVSDGIVSALGRQFMGAGKFIQITAPISPGSSGSPVVNMRGEVIGVASGAYTGNHVQNINFCSAGENVSALSPGNGYSLGKMDKPAWAIAAEKRKSEEEDRIRQLQQRQKTIADIRSMSDQAYTKATAGDNQAALQLYEKCLSLCRQIEDNRCAGTYLRNMGIILERMGKREEAQQYYARAAEALAKN